jgi:hypothetical protein
MCTVVMTADALALSGRKPVRFTLASVVFAALMLFVGAVSVYDGYLVIRTGEDIVQYERNPVGLYLLQCDHGDPTLFLMTKALGTSAVLAALTVLYRRSPRLAFPVASTLMLFQAGLLLFLERA